MKGRLHYGAIGAILLLFLFGFSPYHVLIRSHLVADDASYLSHGFTLGLDFNLKYEGMVADWKTRQGNAAAHPIGPGLLASPFIMAFSVIDRLSKEEVIQSHAAYRYSWSFYGFVFAACFFFLAGLRLSQKALEECGLALPPGHFLFIASSYGILYYVLFRPVMGHAFEFFTLSLCLWSSTCFFNKPFRYRSVWWCALSIVLTLQIRPSNINVILLPFIVMGTTVLGGHKMLSLKKAIIIFVLLVGCIFLCFVPFAIINKMLYGMIYPSSDAMYGNHVNPVPALGSGGDLINALRVLITRLPQLDIIFFSSEFGLLFSSGFLFFGMILMLYCLIFSIKHPVKLALFIFLVGLYAGLPLAIILFWQSTGEAYAYRFLFCLFPVALLGYAFWKKQFLRKSKWASPLQGMIFAFCAYGLIGEIVWGINPSLMYNAAPNAFGRQENGGAVGYNVSVLKALPQPSIWLNVVATRTPGFLAVGLLDALQLSSDLPSIPGLSEKMNKFHASYEYPPPRIYAQVFLLGLLFVGGYLFCLRRFP